MLVNGKNLTTIWYDEDLDIYLHRGFRDAAHVLYEDIKRNYRLERTVYLTGHSLGGAIAQIIGLWLDNDEYNIQIYRSAIYNV